MLGLFDVHGFSRKLHADTSTQITMKIDGHHDHLISINLSSGETKHLVFLRIFTLSNDNPLS
jgi:hypothetical protein